MPERPPASSPQPPRARWRPDIQARLSTLRLAPEREAEIVDELSDDLDDRWRDLVSSGLEPDAATDLIVEDLRGRNLLAQYMAPLKQSNAASTALAPQTGKWHADLWQDFRFAVRSLFRQPVFAAASILTLALAIGVNSTLFGVVRGVLLEALPYADADRLYRLETVDAEGRGQLLVSPPDFVSLRENRQVFSHIEAYTAGAVTMTGSGDPREVRAASVSHGMFDLLGLQLAAGRSFAPEEHQPGSKGAVVLDYGFWQRAFGGSSDAIGRVVRVGGAAYTVTGILANGARLPIDRPGVRMSSDADLYMPMTYGESFNAGATEGRGSRYLAVLGRARSGVSARHAGEDLQRIALQLQSAYPQTNKGVSIGAVPVLEVVVGDVRRPLLVLLGAVGFVLLIACANVASLMLARGSARREELAVRAALGAGRGRLIRLLVTESLAIGLAGGLLGLGLAHAGLRALVAAQPEDIPRIEAIGVDGVVIIFTFVLAFLSSLIFGALPAMRATDRLSPGLRTSGRGGGADRRAQRLRAGLIVSEIALAVVLLTGAGLLLRSLTGLTSVAPGFVSDDVASFRIALYGRGYSPERVSAWVNELETDLRSQPGVVAVAATSRLPVSGPGQVVPFTPHIRVADAGVSQEIGLVSVTPGYVRAIGAQLLAGRDFTSADRKDSVPVAIINEAARRRWFRDVDPVGRQVQVAGGTREIVGVIGDVQQGDPRNENEPQLLVPFEQRQVRAISLVVRSAPGAATSSAIRASVRRLDPNLAISELRPLQNLQALVVARPRFYTVLLMLCASIALVLAATGIFGVMSYLATERTREFGIRMALGAKSNDVLRMVLGRSLSLALAGVAGGLLGAAALGQMIRHQLFGVDLFDPLTLVVVITTLVMTAMLAAWLPARRASRLDPVTTLNRG
jgi:putative ABC transport system permease protein